MTHAPEDLPGLTAEETPALRRELVEHMRGEHAALMFALMIQMGRQSIRPPGSHGAVGRALAIAEADRLERADLWHIDADLAELVDAAYPSMPSFAPRPYDLPSRHGFATFARPLTAMIRDAIPADRLATEYLASGAAGGNAGAVGRLAPHVDEPVAIVAVSWGPGVESAIGTGPLAGPRSPIPWNRPSVWMSFWSVPPVRQHGVINSLSPAERDVYSKLSARLNVDNECLLAWCPDGADETEYLIGPNAGYVGTAGWAAAVFATFTLARQGNITEEDEQPVPRPERRRHERAGLPAPKAVRVLRLRRSVPRAVRADTSPGRVYRHRWVVRGHWRNVWYPSIQAHRPKWIAQTIATPAGVPADAPLLGGDKVTRVSAPKGPQP